LGENKLGATAPVPLWRYYRVVRPLSMPADAHIISTTNPYQQTGKRL